MVDGRGLCHRCAGDISLLRCRYPYTIPSSAADHLVLRPRKERCDVVTIHQMEPDRFVVVQFTISYPGYLFDLLSGKRRNLFCGEFTVAALRNVKLKE